MRRKGIFGIMTSTKRPIYFRLEHRVDMDLPGRLEPHIIRDSAIGSEAVISLTSDTLDPLGECIDRIRGTLLVANAQKELHEELFPGARVISQKTWLYVGTPEDFDENFLPKDTALKVALPADPRPTEDSIRKYFDPLVDRVRSAMPSKPSGEAPPPGRPGP